MSQGEAGLRNRDRRAREAGRIQRAAAASSDPSAAAGSGILPCQALEALVEAGEIAAPSALLPGQIQPASLDLRLGPKAHRVRASFLPGPARTVAEKLAQFSLHQIDLREGAVLETGCVYVVELEERLRLSPGLAGRANPKSSIGRIDILTRLIADRASEFDRVPPGYAGPLYAEIAPLTFGIVVRRGSRLNQLRLGRGAWADEAQARALGEALGAQPGTQRGALDLTIDLAGDPKTGVVGYRARRHAALIDIDKMGHYEPREFWDPVTCGPARELILDPNEFYILASKEPVEVPPDCAAEMIAYDTQVGEFRAHYAGFFDPGFGCHAGGGAGTRAVLEVRSHKIPFILQDGQIVGRLIYEPMASLPERLYGAGIGSSYQAQGLALSKHFKSRSG